MLAVNKRPDGRIIQVNRVKEALILDTDNGMIKLQPESNGIIRNLLPAEREQESKTLEEFDFYKTVVPPEKGVDHDWVLILRKK